MDCGLDYGWVIPQEYDAVGDGITDDRLAFQKALDSGKPVYVPYTSQGYVIGSRLRMEDGATIRVAEKKPLIKLGTSGEWLFEIVGSDIEILNVKGYFNHLSSGGFTLLRSDIASAIERVNIDNSLLFGATGVIHDLPGAGRIVFLEGRRIKSYGTRGRGLNLSRSFAYQHMESLSILYNGIANPHIGICQIGNEGSFWDKCDVTCGMVTPELSAAHGFYFQSCQAMWIDRCMADMVGGGGFFFDGGNNHIYMGRCVASMVGTHGFSITNNGNDISLEGCKAGGRKGLAYAPDMPGIFVANTPDVLIDDACKTYNTVGGAAKGVQWYNAPNIRNNARMV